MATPLAPEEAVTLEAPASAAMAVVVAKLAATVHGIKLQQALSTPLPSIPERAYPEPVYMFPPMTSVSQVYEESLLLAKLPSNWRAREIVGADQAKKLSSAVNKRAIYIRTIGMLARQQLGVSIAAAMDSEAKTLKLNLTAYGKHLAEQEKAAEAAACPTAAQAQKKRRVGQ